MEQKDFEKKLHEFTIELNKHIESYVSSHMIFRIQKTLRIRSMIEIHYENGRGSWIFDNAKICKEMHIKLKEVMIMKEAMYIHKIMSEEEKK